MVAIPLTRHLDTNGNLTGLVEHYFMVQGCVHDDHISASNQS